MLREVMECRYDGYTIQCCPHAIGITHGKERVLVYQFDGGSRGGLPPGGAWQGLDIAKISKIRIHKNQDWRTGPKVTRPRTAIYEVHFQI